MRFPHTCMNTHICICIEQYFLTTMKQGQAKAHFSVGDALSSRGAHMKEQQNIKECPRIHCGTQCEDNLAVMENLDQRPGLHNCTFPNKHSGI